jgi:hypothetical protein
MDKKGYIKGIGDNVKVFVPRSKAVLFLAQPRNREWVLIIKFIGSYSYTLPHFVILKAKGFN